MHGDDKTDSSFGRGDEQALIDLLVDGELDEHRRGELLSRLDEQPDGWRRCALAFLEVQAWRQGLAGLGRQTDVQPPAHDQRPAVEATAPAARQTLRHWSWPSPGMLLAMAASFLIAFAAALAWRGGWPERDLAPAAGQLAGAIEQPSVEPRQDSSGLAQSDSGEPAAVDPYGVVTLLVEAGPEGRPSEVQLPVVVSSRLDPEWFAERPFPLPEDVVRALREAGHEVRQERQLWPLRLDDGRQLIVPVDQVDVRPAKWEAY